MFHVIVEDRLELPIESSLSLVNWVHVIDVKLLHSLNIHFTFSIFLISNDNILIFVRDIQLLNIDFILTTLLVLKLEKSNVFND